MSEASIHFRDSGHGKMSIELRIDGQHLGPGTLWDDLALCQKAALASFHHLIEKGERSIDGIERPNGRSELHA